MNKQKEEREAKYPWLDKKNMSDEINEFLIGFLYGVPTVCV